MGNRELLPTSVPAVMGVVLILLQENQWEGDRDPSLGKSERSDRGREILLRENQRRSIALSGKFGCQPYNIDSRIGGEDKSSPEGSSSPDLWKNI